MFSTQIRILVVDDMSTMRKIVTKSCQALGFTDFIDAADGALAFNALESSTTPVGLIISDWNMPNCSGLDFLKKVRADSRFKNLPFILVTAESEKDQIIEAIKSGVSGYVIKPFTPDILAKKMEEVHARVKK
jgi:two-component system, chemotaxis family, chemotaxis protein CheY